MSNLVTLVTTFYDGANRRIKNLNVKSRYKGSTLENLGKTDSSGQFVFKASPNKTVEILAKPPNTSDYTIFKTINSSQGGTWDKPLDIKLPKKLEEYKNGTQTPNGLVSTLFKVVDSNGRALKNFPVQTRPKGKSSFERTTDENGILKVDSSPNRDIEVLVLNSKDQFVLKSSINSGNGSQQPISIQIDEPFEKFKSTGVINLYDRDGSHYIIKKTNVEIHFLETNKKKVFVISNGKINMNSMVGQKMQLTVFKPDGKPLTPVIYIAKRVKEKPFSLHMDVDITSGNTDINKPTIEVKIGACACNRDITKEEFQKVTNNKKALTFLEDLNKQFKKLKMENCLEKAHFIAHTLHETASYTLLEENLAGKPESSVYDGYKGRGLMQVTYEKNYKAYGLAVNGNFLGSNKVKLATEKEHAIGSAIWYWQSVNLSTHALKNDLIATCALINGGYNGFDDREAYYKKCVAAFNIKQCNNLNPNIISTLNNYTAFQNSYVYTNKIGECFGWDLWNDPNGNKKGKTKNPSEAKKGYTRFLTMSKDKDFPFGYTTDNKGKKEGRKRYGYSADSAKKFAEKRLKEL